MEGDYIVLIRTERYRNHDGMLVNGSCCKPLPQGTGNTPSCMKNGCNSYFYYCLRSLGATGPGCSGGRTSQVSMNDAALRFDQTMVLGLPNPLPLPGLTREWNVSF